MLIWVIYPLMVLPKVFEIGIKKVMSTTYLSYNLNLLLAWVSQRRGPVLFLKIYLYAHLVLMKCTNLL